ncbi:hypothetical protein JD844_013637 [Phrynosoma platyrhinos]|uniref:Uncharacterized protein n=1 Tax=Phrynosoma platyrhinos TaxID=52577 RepID=A0ABQ7TM59_PHRPL|nr:hypothetical protein JD844_013637 [Phrynosoma platyrhinos]
MVLPTSLSACPRLKRTIADAITEDTRMEFACYSPRVHYGHLKQVAAYLTRNLSFLLTAFRARVERESQESAFRVYEVTILEPLQFSK